MAALPLVVLRLPRTYFRTKGHADTPAVTANRREVAAAGRRPASRCVVFSTAVTEHVLRALRFKVFAPLPYVTVNIVEAPTARKLKSTK